MAALKTILLVLFCIAAVAIIIIVLLQEGKSAGLGSLNGGETSKSYWDRNKKHTLEGKFETWTKLTAGFFVVAALIMMVMNGIPTAKVNNGAAVETPSVAATASPAATDDADAGNITVVNTNGEEVDANGNKVEDNKDEAQDKQNTDEASDTKATPSN